MNKFLGVVMALVALGAVSAFAHGNDCPNGLICESTRTGGWIDGRTFSRFDANASGDEAFAYGDSETSATVWQETNAPAEGDLHSRTEIGFGSFSSDGDGDGSSAFGEGDATARGRITTDGGMGHTSNTFLRTDIEGHYFGEAEGDETIAYGQGNMEATAWQGIGERGEGSLHADFSAGSAAFSFDENGGGASASGHSGVSFEGDLNMGTRVTRPIGDD